MQYRSLPSETLIAPLTTAEKRFLNRCIRANFGGKQGRTPKAAAGGVIKTYTDIINKSKNTKRRSRTLTQANEVLKLKTEKITFKERVNQSEEKSEHKTYLDAVAEIYPDDDGSNDRKTAQKLKKQVERFKKRKLSSKKSLKLMSRSAD